MIGGLGEFAVDPKHRLALGHHQSGEVLSEVSPLAFVGEEVAVLSQSVLHDLGKFDDSWHEQMLHTPFAQAKNGQNPLHFPHFYTVGREFAKDQFYCIWGLTRFNLLCDSLFRHESQDGGECHGTTIRVASG